jgi:hypothetical protein
MRLRGAISQKAVVAIGDDFPSGKAKNFVNDVFFPYLTIYLVYIVLIMSNIFILEYFFIIFYLLS